jgi:hypothetical protein
LLGGVPQAEVQNAFRLELHQDLVTLHVLKLVIASLDSLEKDLACDLWRHPELGTSNELLDLADDNVRARIQHLGTVYDADAMNAAFGLVRQQERAQERVVRGV